MKTNEEIRNSQIGIRNCRIDLFLDGVINQIQDLTRQDERERVIAEIETQIEEAIRCALPALGDYRQGAVKALEILKDTLKTKSK